MNPEISWLERRSDLEDGCFVSVGGLISDIAELHCQMASDAFDELGVNLFNRSIANESGD